MTIKVSTGRGTEAAQGARFGGYVVAQVGTLREERTTIGRAQGHDAADDLNLGALRSNQHADDTLYVYWRGKLLLGSIVGEPASLETIALWLGAL